MTTPVFLGIDIGTSGIRGCCIDEKLDEIVNHHIAFNSAQISSRQQDPNPWLEYLDSLISTISEQLTQKQAADKTPDTQTTEKHTPYKICAISIDGTSSTLIACNKNGEALAPALMYNNQQSQKQAECISRFAPKESAVHGASSSLAKALLLLEQHPETELFCHQADWLASSLTGRYGISDENNCLKLGYDSVKQCWPSWLQKNSENAVISKSLLPKVVTPGSFVSKVKPELIEKYSLAKDCMVIAGTTDSNAAVLATGANQAGDAVTSLGSTLVVKLFSEKPLYSPEHGIYSHRLNNQWLAGGASNSGGNVLLHYFTPQKIDEMTSQLKPEQTTGLDYYPLVKTGERFPSNDNNKKNITEPRPEDDVIFFQALLEGIANIEANAYKKLNELGATQVKRIFTAGGGSKNKAWQKIREQKTGVTVLCADHTEACYGSALLAKEGFIRQGLAEQGRTN